MVAYKSSETEEELAAAEYAISLLGGKLEKNELFDLDENTKRRILVIRKVKHTPPGYPRKGNKPRTSPCIR